MVCKLNKLKAEVQALVRKGCSEHKVEVLLERQGEPKELVKKLVREVEA